MPRLNKLNKVPVATWPAGDTELLCGAAGAVVNAKAEGGDLGEAAGLLVDSLVESLDGLELAMRSKDTRRAVSNLPYAVILRVVSSNSLVVRSEDTVLVTVMSWLAVGGADASQVQRREVLQAVRLRCAGCAPAATA